MSFLHADPINCEIIALSLRLQREISKGDGPEGPTVGAQQVMPMREHVNLFGPKNPLPWVPDWVGADFTRENNGVLVVGSSYNGFIEGYSSRSMKLEDYLAVQNLVLDGDENPAHPKVAEACAKFFRDFEEQVMSPDAATYYGLVFKCLLGNSGIQTSRACLSDLCKASFVRRGYGNNPGMRGDVGSDGIIIENWTTWMSFLTCRFPGAGGPLPFQWLWRRMQQCRHIIALGTIAEYGVIKIFKAMAESPTIVTRNGGRIELHKSLKPDGQWIYDYADSTRKLSHWLDTKNWWVLSDDTTCQKWNLLPVYHPAARPPYADFGYARTGVVIEEMVFGADPNLFIQ